MQEEVGDMGIMKDIRHTGIYVKDMAAMLEFYKDIFGLKEMVRQNERGEYISTVLGESNVDIDVCKLAFQDGSMIELIYYKAMDDEIKWEEKLFQCGKMHIAITIFSAWEMYNRLKEKGCFILSEPCESPDQRARVFFARDIEGNYLELVEELQSGE